MTVFLLSVCRSESQVKDATVCGFGLVITDIQTICERILVAIGLYCIMDIPYPKTFLSLLNLVEALLFGISLKLTKKVTKEFDSVVKKSLVV